VTTLGLRASTNFTINGFGNLRPTVQAGWQHEFLDASQQINSAFVSAPGSLFTVNGSSFGRDSALVGFGVTHDLSASAKLFLDYGGKFTGGLQEHAVSGGFRVNF
jgi:outer membrane autotransporter protein